MVPTGFEETHETWGVYPPLPRLGPYKFLYVHRNPFTAGRCTGTVMRSIPTRVFVAVNATCFTVLVVTGTVTAAVTAGVYTWEQLLTVLPRPVAVRYVSGVFGLLSVFAVIVGMFAYAHKKADNHSDSEDFADADDAAPTAEASSTE